MKVSKEEILAIADELNFSHYGILETENLVFLQEVRDMCAANRCNMYDKTWCCPPACGTLEEISQKAKGFSNGIVLQMTGQMEDDFDVETMMDTEATLKERMMQMIEMLHSKDVEFLPMSAGACTLCKECTYPDAPCRDPAGATSPMEALGMLVSEVCSANGVDYYNGKGTITYTACFLLK